MARKKVEEVKVEIAEEPIAEKPVIKGTVKKVSKKKNVKIANPRVNIRKQPSLDSEIIDVATLNDKFELVSDEDEKFYEIIFNGEQAFVMKEFTTLA